MDFAKYIELVFGAAGVAALFWSSFHGNLSSDTIKLMQDNRQAQDDAIKRLQEDSHEKDKQIAELAGQVNMLKDVPLANIAKSLEIVSQVHVDMQTFIKSHNDQALVLADGIAEKVAGKVIQFIQEQKGNG